MYVYKASTLERLYCLWLYSVPEDIIMTVCLYSDKETDPVLHWWSWGDNSQVGADAIKQLHVQQRTAVSHRTHAQKDDQGNVCLHIPDHTNISRRSDHTTQCYSMWVRWQWWHQSAQTVEPFRSYCDLLLNYYHTVAMLHVYLHILYLNLSRMQWTCIVHCAVDTPNCIHNHKTKPVYQSISNNWWPIEYRVKPYVVLGERIPLNFLLNVWSYLHYLVVIRLRISTWDRY